MLLRAIAIDPDIAASVHRERLRRLCQKGARLSAPHVRTLQAARRRARLVAAVFKAIVTLTDDAVRMFDRLLGQMFRREETARMQRSNAISAPLTEKSACWFSSNDDMWGPTSHSEDFGGS